MKAPSSIIDLIDDPRLLGPYFAGPSWDRWRAVLRAAFALPMSAADLALFHEVAGARDPPQKPVRELVAAVGRGGGKDSIASAIAAHVALSVDSSRLRPGERATVLCLATDRDQAAIAHQYISGYFQDVPALTAKVQRETDTELFLNNGASIIVGTSSIRAPRGRTLCCAILDEAAFWYDDRSTNPAEEIDAAISPGLMRYPGSVKILISSVNKRSGLFYERVIACFGTNDPDTLVVIGPSLTFNPTLDSSVIERELRRDPERAAAEYLCEWRSDISQFLDRELVESSIDEGVVVRSPQPGTVYAAFADPSGGRGDAFAASISHAAGDQIVIDCLIERRSPFNPTDVVNEIAAVLRSYNLSEIFGDRYAAEWCTQGFATAGIRYESSPRDKSSLYLDALPLFTAGRVRLIDNDRLTHQLISLERRATRTGRDIVSHPDHRNAHDDAANAACGALVLASTEAGPQLWHRRDIGAPLQWPHRCTMVFCSAAVDALGVFYVFWAFQSELYGGSRMLLVNYGRSPLDRECFGQILGELTMLASLTIGHVPPPLTGFVICPSVLAQHAETAGLPARPADNMFVDRDALLLVAAGQIGVGNVRIASPAYQTSKKLPNPLLEVRPGAEPSAALDAVMLGIGALLPEEDKPRSWRGVRI